MNTLIELKKLAIEYHKKHKQTEKIEQPTIKTDTQEKK